MELEFTKQGDVYVAEATVNNDYALHIERQGGTARFSVVNSDADYRGGNNNAEWDGTYRTLIGRPATGISRTNFRTYARKRNNSATSEWNCMTYSIQKDLFWLFAIEYATLNTQKAFNASKDSNGYAQGGLGYGVTTLDNNKWASFNERNSFIPCGYTDSLGNGTGEVEFSMPEEYDSAGKTVKVARYRGYRKSVRASVAMDGWYQCPYQPYHRKRRGRIEQGIRYRQSGIFQRQQL